MNVPFLSGTEAAVASNNPLREAVQETAVSGPRASPAGVSSWFDNQLLGREPGQRLSSGEYSRESKGKRFKVQIFGCHNTREVVRSGFDSICSELPVLPVVYVCIIFQLSLLAL